MKKLTEHYKLGQKVHDVEVLNRVGTVIGVTSKTLTLKHIKSKCKHSFKVLDDAILDRFKIIKD